MLSKTLLQTLRRPMAAASFAHRSFASGTHLEKFDFEDPFKFD